MLTGFIRSKIYRCYWLWLNAKSGSLRKYAAHGFGVETSGFPKLKFAGV